MTGRVFHLQMAGIGALAGLAFHVLFEAWDTQTGRPVLFASFAAVALFGALLALAAPGRLLRAAGFAVPIGLVLGGAVVWAAGRHAAVGAFLDLGYPVLSFAVALSILTGFAAAALRSPGGWKHYETLFEESWQAAVRLIVAMVMVGLFWALLALSDVLLQTVGLRVIDWLTESWRAWLLSGLVFGLSVAVLEGLRDYISPYLVLRLLRLFVPVVLLVEAVFVVALTFSGWDAVGGGLSPSGILITFGIVSVCLVSIAVDRDAGGAVKGRGMRGAVAALAGLVPVLAVLALWAIVMRVDQYGWTPARLMAATAAVALGVYGIAYALAVVLRRGWMARIRAANIALAWGVAAVCLIWLSPLLVPEAISARGQVVQAEEGQGADRLALRELAGKWGLPGQEALARIETARPDLSADILAARMEPSLQTAPVDLASRVPVYPEGALTPKALANWEIWRQRMLDAACTRSIPEGPGCAIYITQGTGDAPEAGFLFEANWGRVDLTQVAWEDGRLITGGDALVLEGETSITMLRRLHSGEAVMTTREFPVLTLGDVTVFPLN